MKNALFLYVAVFCCARANAESAATFDETIGSKHHVFGIQVGASINLFIRKTKSKWEITAMSAEQVESQVLALPLAERRAFTRWLDEHRDEIE
jgi:hypothetical protein